MVVILEPKVADFVNGETEDRDGRHVVVIRASMNGVFGLC